jgi:hypothetical protein
MGLKVPSASLNQLPLLRFVHSASMVRQVNTQDLSNAVEFVLSQRLVPAHPHPILASTMTIENRS